MRELRTLTLAVVLGSCTPVPCAPIGARLECECASGAIGIAVCRSDGLGPCVCGDEDAPGADGGALDGGTAPDVPEGGAFDTGGGDAEVADASGDAGMTADAPSGTCRGPLEGTWDGTIPTEGICAPEGLCVVSPAPPFIERVVSADAVGDHLWIVAANGANQAIYHWDGARWTGTLRSLPDVRWIRALASDDVWLGTATEVHHYDGAAFSHVADAPAGMTTVAIAADEVWAYGTFGQLRRLGGTGFVSVDAGVGTADIIGVWGARDDVWIDVTGGVIRHFDGTAWRDRSAASGGRVVLSSGGETWTTGFERWNGSTWVRHTPARLYSTAGDAMLGPDGHVYFPQADIGRLRARWNGTAIVDWSLRVPHCDHFVLRFGTSLFGVGQPRGFFGCSTDFVARFDDWLSSSTCDPSRASATARLAVRASTTSSRRDVRPHGSDAPRAVLSRVSVISLRSVAAWAAVGRADVIAGRSAVYSAGRAEQHGRGRQETQADTAGHEPGSAGMNWVCTVFGHGCGDRCAGAAAERARD